MIAVRRWLRTMLLAAATTAVLCAWGGRAHARTDHQSPYTYKQTFGSALRLLRVDLGLKITDKDPDWGYLLFEYQSVESGKRRAQGSFQFVRTRTGVKVSVQLPSMPSYHERLLLDKLTQKLRAEHGDPPRRNKPKPDQRKRDSKPSGDGDGEGDGEKQDGKKPKEPAETPKKKSR